MAAEPAPSRREVLAGVADTLRGAGVAEPRREALRLWNELSRLDSAEALVRSAEPVEPELAAALARAAERRASGEPLAHVAGRIGFRTLVLRTDRRALIPRPETEGLVDLLLARARTGRVADIGTGTGALALSLAVEGNFDQVLGVDFSGDALELAAENRASIAAAVHLVRGDLCGPLRAGGLDALVSNPPYLSRQEYAGLDAAVSAWEPAGALMGGTEGIELTARLLDEARIALRPGGWIAIEVDCDRARLCARRAGELGWSDIAVHADLFGRERYLLARRSTTT